MERWRRRRAAGEGWREERRGEWGGESKVTSHGANSEPRVPEDGLPIGLPIGLICFQTLTSGSLSSRRKQQFVPGLEASLPTNL